MKQDKIKKDKKVKETPFNFKEWLKNVLDSTSSRKRVKKPKIEAIFKLLIVECLKSDSEKVVDLQKNLGVHSFTIFSGYSTKMVNSIYSPKKDVDVVLSLVDSTNLTEDKMYEFSNNLKNCNVNDFYIYSIKPTSADLNLIYLLKGVQNG